MSDTFVHENLVIDESVMNAIRAGRKFCWLRGITLEQIEDAERTAKNRRGRVARGFYLVSERRAA